MRNEHKGSLIVLVMLGIMIFGLGIYLILFVDKVESNTRVIEVGQDNSSYYCNIEYFDFENVTPEAVEKNRQKCAKAVAKLFGSDKADDVKIRYRQHR